MEATTLHITEYIGNQEIDFFGITSFKVQNHGEAVIDVNTIAVYPGETFTLIEQDFTKCDFRLSAKFSEAGKMPKFRVIYKKIDGRSDVNVLLPEDGLYPYKVNLLNYELGDQLEFIHNKAGLVLLQRSFEFNANGDLIFENEHSISISAFTEANTVVKYDQGGSFDTKAIRFWNYTTDEYSEIFMVNGNVRPVVVNFDITANWSSVGVFDELSFRQFLTNRNTNGQYENNLTQIIINGFSLVGNKLTCYLSANGTILNLNQMDVVEFKGIGNISGLLTLLSGYSNLTSFDPSFPLPNTLSYLFLSLSQLTSFNPAIRLPVSLIHLNLGGNPMTTEGYEVSEEWANSQPSFTNPCQIYFYEPVNWIGGTNLQTILLTKNVYLTGEV
jgi:hypothetical protein